MVLVESLLRMESGDAVLEHMSTYGSASLLASSHLEAIAIALVKTIVEHPTVIYDDRESSVIQVPAIIGVMPRAASMKLIARTREELDGKSIGIATIRPWVIVIIGITVDDDIVSTIFIFLVTGVVAITILSESLLQTGVPIAIEAAEFHHAVGAFELHAIVGGVADVEPTIMPIVGTYLVHDATIGGSLGRSGARLTREIEDRSLSIAGIGEDTDTIIGSTRLRDVNGLREMIGATSHIEDVTSLQSGECLDRVAERFVDCHTVAGTAWRQVVVLGISLP